MSYLFGLFFGILVFVISVLSVLCREWARERFSTLNGYTFPFVPVALAVLVGIALKQNTQIILVFSVSSALSFIVIDRSLLIRNQVKVEDHR